MSDRTTLIVVVLVIVAIVLIWWWCDSRRRRDDNRDHRQTHAKGPKVSTPLTPDRIMAILRDPETQQQLMIHFRDKGDLADGETYINIMLDHIEGLIMPRK